MTANIVTVLVTRRFDEVWQIYSTIQPILNNILCFVVNKVFCTFTIQRLHALNSIAISLQNQFLS